MALKYVNGHKSVQVCSSLNSCIFKRKNSTKGHKAEEETEASFTARVSLFKSFRAEIKESKIH